MPALSKIQEPVPPKDIALDFGEDENGEPIVVHMTVLPARFNMGRERRLNEAIRTGNRPAQCEEVLKVIQSWDLTDDEGNVLPLDDSGLDHLEYGTVVALAQKMAEALRAPKPETGSA